MLLPLVCLIVFCIHHNLSTTIRNVVKRFCIECQFSNCNMQLIVQFIFKFVATYVIIPKYPLPVSPLEYPRLGHEWLIAAIVSVAIWQITRFDPKFNGGVAKPWLKLGIDG